MRLDCLKAVLPVLCLLIPPALAQQTIIVDKRVDGERALTVEYTMVWAPLLFAKTARASMSSPSKSSLLDLDWAPCS